MSEFSKTRQSFLGVYFSGWHLLKRFWPALLSVAVITQTMLYASLYVISTVFPFLETDSRYNTTQMSLSGYLLLLVVGYLVLSVSAAFSLRTMNDNFLYPSNTNWKLSCKSAFFVTHKILASALITLTASILPLLFPRHIALLLVSLLVPVFCMFYIPAIVIEGANIFEAFKLSAKWVGSNFFRNMLVGLLTLVTIGFLGKVVYLFADLPYLNQGIYGLFLDYTVVVVVFLYQVFAYMLLISVYYALFDDIRLQHSDWRANEFAQKANNISEP